MRPRDLVRTQELATDTKLGPILLPWSHLLTRLQRQRELGAEGNGCGCCCRSDKWEHLESTLELDGRFSCFPANCSLRSGINASGAPGTSKCPLGTHSKECCSLGTVSIGIRGRGETWLHARHRGARLGFGASDNLVLALEIKV